MTNPRNKYKTEEERRAARVASVLKYNRSAKGRAKISANRARKRELYMLIQSRFQARRYGREFSITVDDIIIPEYCPMLGIKLEKLGKKRSPSSPSIDRIDSSKGYIPGNVHVISWRANKLKNDGTAAEFMGIANYLAKLEVAAVSQL